MVSCGVAEWRVLEKGGGAFGFMLHLSRIDKIVTVVILLVFSVRFLIVLLLFL